MTRKLPITEELKPNEVLCWTCSACGRVVYNTKDIGKHESCNGQLYFRSAIEKPCKDCHKSGNECQTCYFKEL
jgi:hypothetical protein